MATNKTRVTKKQADKPIVATYQSIILPNQKYHKEELNIKPGEYIDVLPHASIWEYQLYQGSRKVTFFSESGRYNIHRSSQPDMPCRLAEPNQFRIDTINIENISPFNEFDIAKYGAYTIDRISTALKLARVLLWIGNKCYVDEPLCKMLDDRSYFTSLRIPSDYNWHLDIEEVKMEFDKPVGLLVHLGGTAVRGVM